MEVVPVVHAAPAGQEGSDPVDCHGDRSNDFNTVSKNTLAVASKMTLLTSLASDSTSFDRPDNSSHQSPSPKRQPEQRHSDRSTTLSSQPQLTRGAFQSEEVATNGATAAPSTGPQTSAPRLQIGLPPYQSHNGCDVPFVGDAPQGQKRTASGHVKTPSASVTVSPVDDAGRGHSRNSSSTSQVGELRARLSYAMIKVQNGWESRTIDEVEALASQHPSPMLVSPRRAVDSRTDSAGKAACVPTKPSIVYMTSPSQQPQRVQHPMGPHVHHGTLGKDYAYGSPVDRFTSSVNGKGPPPCKDHDIPSLAPPLDFSARHPRRTDSPQHLLQPTALLNGTRNLSNLSTSSASSALSAPYPATPPQQQMAVNPRSALKSTPSQHASAMEKDAIETLLFMSSPGNSQQYHNSLQQQQHDRAGKDTGTSSTPRTLRQQQQRPQQLYLQSSPKSTARSRNGNHSYNHRNHTSSPEVVAMLGTDDAMVPLSPRKKGLLDSAELSLDSEESIDRVLDLMNEGGEGGSSSEDEDGDIAMGLGMYRPGVPGGGGGAARPRQGERNDQLSPASSANAQPRAKKLAFA